MDLVERLKHLVLLLLNPMVLIPASILIVVLVKKNKEYKAGAYYKITKHPFLAVYYNAGRYGEYLTYKYLQHMEANGAKFLFNVYVPKETGETTEIDVLMICAKGLFVFESKNYSGWIFGSEHQKNWYQTLPSGRGRSHKEHFYNPVMQNRSHIKHLGAYLGEQVPMWSVIVFSDRCTLKNVQIKSSDINVINRYNVAHAVSDICNRVSAEQLSENSISEIYDKLYPLTQVSDAAKLQHIANIQSTLKGRPAHTEKPLAVPPAVSKVEESEQLEPPKSDTESTDVTVEAPIVAVEPETLNKTPLTSQVSKCPYCHGDLILRTATRGANAGNQFYGCSNYPRCKYIRNITNEETVVH